MKTRSQAGEAQSTTKATMCKPGPKLLDGLGVAGFAKQYGVSERFLRRYGIRRFAKLPEPARQVIVADHLHDGYTKRNSVAGNRDGATK